jgi:siroheme synthase (precorrin-2 oxidase/ferrochelatase)
MRAKNQKVLDIIVVGTGIAGLNFIDKYLEKGKKINVISPKKNSLLKANCSNKIKILPSQMRGKHSEVDNYFAANDLETQFNCKAIGSLSFGGLSNYWGLQIDNYINNDQKI